MVLQHFLIVSFQDPPESIYSMEDDIFDFYLVMFGCLWPAISDEDKLNAKDSRGLLELLVNSCKELDLPINIGAMEVAFSDFILELAHNTQEGQAT